MSAARHAGPDAAGTLVVTGFGPFGDVADNPSGRLAAGLAGAVIAGHRVIAEVLPTTFGGARAAVQRLVHHTPTAALAIGVATMRPGYELERRARGVVSNDRPDIAGEVWFGRALPGGACENPWPLAEVAAALAAQGHDVRCSDDAGGYVCDATYQALLVASASRAVPIPVAFLHIPGGTDAAALAEGTRVVRGILENLVARAMVRAPC